MSPIQDPGKEAFNISNAHPLLEGPIFIQAYDRVNPPDPIDFNYWNPNEVGDDRWLSGYHVWTGNDEMYMVIKCLAEKLGVTAYFYKGTVYYDEDHWSQQFDEDTVTIFLRDWKGVLETMDDFWEACAARLYLSRKANERTVYLSTLVDAADIMNFQKLFAQTKEYKELKEELCAKMSVGH